MRILRLVSDGSYAVEFHPYITVVTGTTEGQRRSIVEAFEQAALGRTTELRGLIEVHGVVLDLDERSLGLLELDGRVEICVAASDLPGSATGGVGRQVAMAEQRLEALEQPHRDRLSSLSEAEAELEAALAAHRQAAEPDERTHTEIRARLPDDLEALHAEREALIAQLDPSAGPVLDGALADLADANAAVERTTKITAALPPDDRPESSEHDDLLADLRAAMSLHRLDDPVAVRDALDEVRLGHSTGEMVPSAEALSLADRLDSLDREIAHGDDDAPSSGDIEAARDRVEQARLALAAHERADTSDARPESVAGLEAAHAEVERARDGIGGRWARARAQRRLDAARAAEDEWLARLGLTSYTEYLTHGGAVAPATRETHDESPELERARVEVERAEAEARSLEARREASLALAEKVDERRRLRERAQRLLGGTDAADDDLSTDLLNLRVPADNAGPVAELAETLDAVGLPVRGLGLTDDEIEAMAADWLTEHQHTEARLLRRIEELEAMSGDHAADAAQAFDDLESAGTAAEAKAEGPSPAAAHDTVFVAQEAVQAAKDRVVAHERVVTQLAKLEEAISEAESAIEMLALHDDRVDAARRAVDDAAAVVDAGQVDYAAAVEELAALRQTVADLTPERPAVEELEWYLLARLAGQRQQSFVGSLPLVIVEALDDVEDDDGLEHLLDRLERMAGAVQIVHLSDDPRIASWAAALAGDRAVVVQPVPARID